MQLFVLLQLISRIEKKDVFVFSKQHVLPAALFSQPNFAQTLTWSFFLKPLRVRCGHFYFSWQIFQEQILKSDSSWSFSQFCRSYNGTYTMSSVVSFSGFSHRMTKKWTVFHLSRVFVCHGLPRYAKFCWQKRKTMGYQPLICQYEIFFSVDLFPAMYNCSSNNIQSKPVLFQSLLASSCFRRFWEFSKCKNFIWTTFNDYFRVSSQLLQKGFFKVKAFFKKSIFKTVEKATNSLWIGSRTFKKAFLRQIVMGFSEIFEMVKMPIVILAFGGNISTIFSSELVDRSLLSTIKALNCVWWIFHIH